MLALLLACAPPAPDASPDTADTCSPTPPAWGAPVTTRTQRLVLDARRDPPLPLDPALPDGLAAAEEEGLGTWTVADGESWLRRDDLAPGHGGEDGRSLLLFFHESDAQIADPESPTRFVAADDVGELQSAARPQELYALHALDALVRTANALNALVPIDFALATGDDADNDQRDELQWFDAVWDGVPVRPDSGDADSQLDEDCNDPLAEFEPAGADFPWYTVAGNHDVLVQGNFAPDAFVDDALGSDAPGGTRDLSQPGGPLAWETVADEGRALMERSDIAAVHLDSPATPGPVGHGFTEANVTDDTVTWAAQPVASAPVVVLAVDANPDDQSTGVLPAAQRDGFLVPALEAAEAAHQLVILTSHYALGDLMVDDGTRLVDTLTRYPCVVLSIVGHSHRNTIRPYGTPGDAGAFWEITTSSTVDWPGEGRLVELVVHDDGTLSVWTTMVDYLAPEGSMAARARVLTAMDWQAGWRDDDGTGEVEDRNTELVQVLPEGFTWQGAEGVRSLALP